MEDPAVIYIKVFCLCFPLGVYSFWSYIEIFIQFEFTFVYGVGNCSSFILLQVVDQFSHIHPAIARGTINFNMQGK